MENLLFDQDSDGEDDDASIYGFISEKGKSDRKRRIRKTSETPLSSIECDGIAPLVIHAEESNDAFEAAELEKAQEAATSDLEEEDQQQEHNSDNDDKETIDDPIVDSDEDSEEKPVRRKENTEDKLPPPLPATYIIVVGRAVKVEKELFNGDLIVVFLGRQRKTPKPREKRSRSKGDKRRKKKKQRSESFLDGEAGQGEEDEDAIPSSEPEDEEGQLQEDEEQPPDETVPVLSAPSRDETVKKGEQRFLVCGALAREITCPIFRWKLILEKSTGAGDDDNLYLVAAVERLPCNKSPTLELVLQRCKDTQFFGERVRGDRKFLAEVRRRFSKVMPFFGVRTLGTELAASTGLDKSIEQDVERYCRNDKEQRPIIWVTMNLLKEDTFFLLASNIGPAAARVLNMKERVIFWELGSASEDQIATYTAASEGGWRRPLDCARAIFFGSKDLSLHDDKEQRHFEFVKTVCRRFHEDSYSEEHMEALRQASAIYWQCVTAHDKRRLFYLREPELGWTTEALEIFTLPEGVTTSDEDDEDRNRLVSSSSSNSGPLANVALVYRRPDLLRVYTPVAGASSTDRLAVERRVVQMSTLYNICGHLSRVLLGMRLVTVINFTIDDDTSQYATMVLSALGAEYSFLLVTTSLHRYGFWVDRMKVDPTNVVTKEKFQTLANKRRGGGLSQYRCIVVDRAHAFSVAAIVGILRTAGQNAREVILAGNSDCPSDWPGHWFRDIATWGPLSSTGPFTLMKPENGLNWGISPIKLYGGSHGQACFFPDLQEAVARLGKSSIRAVFVNAALRKQFSDAMTGSPRKKEIQFCTVNTMDYMGQPCFWTVIVLQGMNRGHLLKCYQCCRHTEGSILFVGDRDELDSVYYDRTPSLQFGNLGYHLANARRVRDSHQHDNDIINL